MVGTQVYIMNQSTRTKVNEYEFITLRIGFSLYSGWVMAACIIGVAFFLKSLGMKGDNAGLAEDTWCVVIMWVALCIYVVASFMERNPLFAAVYIWVLIAIRADHDNPSKGVPMYSK